MKSELAIKFEQWLESDEVKAIKISLIGTARPPIAEILLPAFLAGAKAWDELDRATLENFLE